MEGLNICRGKSSISLAGCSPVAPFGAVPRNHVICSKKSGQACIRREAGSKEQGTRPQWGRLPVESEGIDNS